MEQQWWKESVVYQIYPRSFNDSNGDGIGDIKGITEKLDYLNKLGIDVVWLSPVYQSPNDDNGYDISDYKSIMDEFGTMDDFEEMLAAAKERDIKIMMDLVVNHTSDEHNWFIEASKSKDNPYHDYYIWKDGVKEEPPNNWGSVFGGSAWKYNGATGEYYLHLFSQKQPDLNWENPKLRAEIYQMMNWWLDKGIDGFRMDVINFISKDQDYPDGEVQPGNEYGDGSPYFIDGPRIHEFLTEMNQEVLAGKDLITVGEMPGVSIAEAKKYTAEDRNEVDMVFHFEHVDLGNGKFGKWTPQEWDLTELKEVFSKWQTALNERGWNSLYWSNHDQPRAVSRFGDDREQYRVVSAKMLATCLHLLKGTPYIYQGEEIGMTNVAFDQIDDYRDIEILNAYRDLVGTDKLSHQQMMEGIHRRGRDNSRTPVHWDDSPHAGFTTGEPWIKVNPNYEQINAAAVLEDPESIFYYYQELIELRKEHDVIVNGKYQLLLEDDQEIYAYLRKGDEETLLVVLNFTADNPEFKLPDDIEFSSQEVLISNYELEEEQAIEQIKLRPYEARVYQLR
ncbi:MAG: glycoside hydrolase family 13 protein [Bacillota bacterium]